MDKIKAFFNNKIVQIVSWIILALDVVVLILGGASVAEIGKGVELVAGIVSAVALLVVFTQVKSVTRESKLSFAVYSLMWGKV